MFNQVKHPQNFKPMFNQVLVSAQEIKKPVWSRRCVSFCKKILRYLRLDNCELSVVFCSSDFMKSLNKKYRGKNEPTDILSFSQEENRLNGDIFISLEMLSANSFTFAVTEEEELKRLLIHGILHLAGQDHTSNNRDEDMLIQQEEILLKFSEEKVF